MMMTDKTAHTLLLPPAESAKVAAAVGLAEMHGDGEIVTVVAHAADAYGDVALAWSALVGGLALLAFTLFAGFTLRLADGVLGLWAHRWAPREVLELALLVVSVKFAATWLILQWRPLRLALTPGPIKTTRVQKQAALVFRLAAQGRTRHGTGVVIYLSLAERRAQIIADTAIAAKVGPEVWGDAMHAMLAQIRAGRVGDGMVAAVEHVGQVLVTHFPRGAKPDNELPDGPIEL